MKIRVVTLDRTPERFETFRRVNPHIMSSAVRHPAIDGLDVDTELLAARKLIDRAVLRTYTPGALGYALTHLALWDEAAEGGTPLTVCDDDAVFSGGFDAAAETALSQLPSSWHFVLWGWNFDLPVVFELLPGVSYCRTTCDQAAMRSGLAQFAEQQVDARLFHLHRAIGTPCYSVSPGGAETLRRHCLPLRPMPLHAPLLSRRTIANVGIDIMMNHLYPLIEAFISFPPLVVTPNHQQVSTIQTGISVADLRQSGASKNP